MESICSQKFPGTNKELLKSEAMLYLDKEIPGLQEYV
jgi:hypothetical protein